MCVRLHSLYFPTVTVKLRRRGLCNPTLFFSWCWPTCTVRGHCPGLELCGYVRHFSARMWQKKSTCLFFKANTRINTFHFSPLPPTSGLVCPFWWNGFTNMVSSVHSTECVRPHFTVDSSALYWPHFQRLGDHKTVDWVKTVDSKRQWTSLVMIIISSPGWEVLIRL